MGNYKSFGDTKFVPDVPQDRLKLFLSCSCMNSDLFNTYFDATVERMYSLPHRHRQLGLGSRHGITTYFSANCEERDAEVAGRFLGSIGLSPYNTRLFKTVQTNGGTETVRYTVLVASALTTSDTGEFPFDSEYTFEGFEFEIRRGDHCDQMRRAAECLRNATRYAANDTQVRMLECYARSFEVGSIEMHKEGSRYWIRDKSPAVESYIGFIESYRDPSGTRGEFEGFVACVNKEISKKFQVLVDSAEQLLTMMPWPKEFEKDEFLRPDFTSLDIIAFGSSGVPAGINIPNYDDIRQREGFKNVSLGNVLKAGYGASGDKPVSFILPKDQQLYKSLMGEAFEVQVGIHELLGHGSGKLFQEEDSEVLATVTNPLTGEVGGLSVYKRNSTWDSTFGKIASNYEECRAECIGIYLCLEPSVLAVFGHVNTEAQSDIIYINWLLMCRAGVLGLEFYTPETKTWRQAHMNARYVILRVLLEAGEGLLSIERFVGADGEPDIHIALDRTKIESVGKPAIGAFLLRLQVYKSTADVHAGGAMFSTYSEVNEDMMNLRSIVMARKEPRKLLVQPNMVMDGSDVQLREYEPTPSGMVQSFVDRFEAMDIDGLFRASQIEDRFVNDIVA